MLVVNNELFYARNIYNFIDVSVNKLVAQLPNLIIEKQYWLFYYIKDDFFADLMSLQNFDINQDFLGFPLIKKNTRHAIEAFIDLNNLCNDDDYLIVLEHCAKKRKDAGKYTGYLFNGRFTIQSKCNMAKSYGKDFQNFIDITSDSNNYVHPNVFVDVISQDNVDEKRRILSELLDTNLYLLINSYQLLLWKYFNNMQPCLGCCVGGNCLQCYNMALNNFKNCIDKRLLVNVYPTPIIFG